MYKVLVVDDHPFIRTALRTLVSEEGYEVVGETDNGVDAISQVRQLTPDLVLLDITMPRLDGIAVIERIRALEVNTRIIVLTSLSSEHYAARCISAGASGFISKTDELSVLAQAMKTVMKGYVYYPETVVAFSRKRALAVDEAQLIASLSNRELSVFQQLSRGMSNKDIAQNILLSSKTVSCYKARLLAKLNVKSVVDLADIARRNNLI
ncbi:MULTISPECIES: response regulator transcription factor [unclassified Pseudomonas]|uniref:response regulator transcription factor n=1 Tax=unclassified Pseudomonas TaxID=196821 RepID=UPI000E6BAD18|nr:MULTISPECIES: response regulator transcription factor [unclassified Pseudomonas]QJI16071.1 response regulator transcription factor [Pseudomonas sp. ADAK22]